MKKYYVVKENEFTVTVNEIKSRKKRVVPKKQLVYDPIASDKYNCDVYQIASDIRNNNKLKKSILSFFGCVIVSLIMSAIVLLWLSGAGSKGYYKANPNNNSDIHFEWVEEGGEE